MAANGISTLASKQARQEAKLELAKTKRQAGGNTNSPAYRDRNNYNIDLLPTKFSGNSVVDNANASGLVEGRPWFGSLTLKLDAGSYSGSGTTWYDLSGNSADITLANSPSYSSGTPSYFAFNGTNQYGTGSKTNVIPTTAYSKSVWFYLNGYQDNNIVSGDGHFIYMGPQANVDRKIYCGHANWPSFVAFPSAATINLNTWYNVTLTFNTANGMTLYINGALDSTYTANKSAHPGTGTVNIANYSGGNLLNGRIAEALCYNRAITATEALQIFNASKSKFGL